MTDDDDDRQGQEAWRQSYAAALQGIQKIQDALRPHAKDEHDLEEMTRLAMLKISNPAGFDRMLDENTRQYNKAQEQVRKLRSAYQNIQVKMPPGQERSNYEAALRAMLLKYGEHPDE
jgi:hypothetical protein